MAGRIKPPANGNGNGNGHAITHQVVQSRFQKLIEDAAREEANGVAPASDATRTNIATTFEPTTVIGNPKSSKARTKRIGSLVIRWLRDVEPEEIDWLWEGRIPLGMLTLFSGDKGSGKSNLASKIAAVVSTGGCWPDDPGRVAPEGSVLILNAEEHVANTFRPRAGRFGADLDRIGVIDAVKLPGDGETVPFSLGLDVETLEAAIVERGDVRLVIVDTITSYLGGIDEHKGADVRRVLEPLKGIAERHKVAFILINHLNKGTGVKALYRSNASIAIPSLCRMTWMVAHDPDDKTRRLLVPSYSNQGTAPAIGFRIERDGEFEWDTEVTEGLDANSLLAREAHVMSRAGRRGPIAHKRQAAEQWLRKQLADGARLLAELVTEGEGLGFTRSTIDRALKAVKAETLETDGVRFVQLPGELNLGPNDSHGEDGSEPPK